MVPYRASGRRGACYYCARPTERACVACAEFVCERCEARHDEQATHREYSG